MWDVERRKYARREIKIAVTVYEKDKKIPATIIDISLGGLALLSQKVITPGSKIKIVLSHTDKYAIGGTVRWAMLVYTEGTDGKFQYRTGIKADKVLNLEDILNNNSF
jgi:hypothetical protein